MVTSIEWPVVAAPVPVALMRDRSGRLPAWAGSFGRARRSVSDAEHVAGLGVSVLIGQHNPGCDPLVVDRR
jgi:hypothetical protein